MFSYVSPADKSKALCQALAEILREKRLAAGLSLTQMEDIADVTRQMISFVEKGSRAPSLVILAKLAQALRLPPSALLKEAEKRSRFR
ncbi:MAG: helix-turn-helix transcriptional regulator [Verrucomicrobiaceae bacterium]